MSMPSKRVWWLRTTTEVERSLFSHYPHDNSDIDWNRKLLFYALRETRGLRASLRSYPGPNPWVSRSL